MQKARFISSLFIIIALLLAGCTTPPKEPATPTPDLASTQTLGAIRTEAALTVAAALTEQAQPPTATVIILSPTAAIENTATKTPTSTMTRPPLPSATASETVPPAPTGTQTPVPLPPTALPEPYQCALLRTSPQYRAVLQPGEDFDAHWTLYNNGTQTWLPAQVVYAFRNGAKMHLYGDSSSLPVQVKPLEKIELVVDMQAPHEAGQYTAYWVLKYNKEDFCWFSVDITVNE